MSRKNETTDKRLRDRLRSKKALDLRLQGKTYEIISAALHYGGPGAAYNAIQRLLKHHEREGVEELRTLESSRLDEMLSGLWATALLGQKDAVEMVLKIMNRRARLLGLDVPAEIHWRGEMQVSHVLILKMGDRPPRLVNLDDPNWDEDLTTEELVTVRDMQGVIEGEARQLPAPKEKADAS